MARERRTDRKGHWDEALTEWVAIQKIRGVQIRARGWRLRKIRDTGERCAMIAERIARGLRVELRYKRARGGEPVKRRGPR